MITYHFVSILLSPIYYGFRIRFSQFYTLSSGTRIKRILSVDFQYDDGYDCFPDRVLCISKCTALKTIRVSKENVFTDMVRWLYRTDTPTNVLPSIHVFNSLAVHMSLTNCEALRDHKGVRYGSLVLTLLIIMSTMFLKQHSVIDVCCGATLALFGYLFFYPQKAGEEASGMAVERIDGIIAGNIIKQNAHFQKWEGAFFNKNTSGDNRI